MIHAKFDLKISVVICMILLSILCAAQSKTKQLKLKFVSYECGDACYYTFNNMATQKEFSFSYEDEVYERCSPNCKKLFAEIDMKCDEKFDNCILKEQEYIATQEYKLVPIYEMTEEGVVNKTNKNEYKWVITDMKKVVSTKLAVENIELPFVGKKYYNIIKDQGNGGITYYSITIKQDGSVYFETEFHSNSGTVYTSKSNPVKYAKIVTCKGGDETTCPYSKFKITKNKIIALDDYNNVINESLCCELFEDRMNEKHCPCESEFSSNK